MGQRIALLKFVLCCHGCVSGGDNVEPRNKNKTNIIHIKRLFLNLNKKNNNKSKMFAKKFDFDYVTCNMCSAAPLNAESESYLLMVRHVNIYRHDLESDPSRIPIRCSHQMWDRHVNTNPVQPYSNPIVMNVAQSLFQHFLIFH